MKHVVLSSGEGHVYSPLSHHIGWKQEGRVEVVTVAWACPCGDFFTITSEKLRGDASRSRE